MIVAGTLYKISTEKLDNSKQPSGKRSTSVVNDQKMNCMVRKMSSVIGKQVKNPLQDVGGHAKEKT